MSNLIFNSINPVSQRSEYKQNDIIEFNMTFDGKSLVPNSIRLTGELHIGTASANIAADEDIKYDSVAGIHGAFSAMTCSSDKTGVIENNNHYRRYVKSKTQANMMDDQVMSNSRMNSALQIGNDDLVAPFLAHSATTITGYKDDLSYTSFSFKPDIALNKSSGPIPSAKTGAVQLSLRLATNNEFLYGGCASQYQYLLRNVKLEYRTQMGGDGGSVQMDSVYTVKNTITSNNANLTTTVPAIVQSVSCVFHEEATLNTAEVNDLENQVVPDVERIDFSFNDQNDAYLAYTLKYLQEILYNYQMSWSSTGKSGFNFKKIYDEGRGYGVGLNFKQLIDMSSQQFGLRIVSGIAQNNVPNYAIFLMFRAVVSL